MVKNVHTHAAQATEVLEYLLEGIDCAPVCSIQYAGIDSGKHQFVLKEYSHETGIAKVAKRAMVSLDDDSITCATILNSLATNYAELYNLE